MVVGEWVAAAVVVAVGSGSQILVKQRIRFLARVGTILDTTCVIVNTQIYYILIIGGYNTCTYGCIHTIVTCQQSETHCGAVDIFGNIATDSTLIETYFWNEIGLYNII